MWKKFVEKLGWKLFPAVWKKGTHCPLVKWKEGSSSDVSTIDGWLKKWPKAYLCVACNQSGITVIDVDNKKGKKGSENLEALQSKYGRFPFTLTVDTPNSGIHFYFKGVSRNTNDVLSSGIDTPGMVPIPGADVTGKGRYRINDMKNIKPLPSWISEKIKKKEKEEVEFVAEPDNPFNILDAIEYLGATKPALEGEGGDALTYATACKLKEMGISRDIAFDSMCRFFNDRCEPPWDLKELMSKVDNAYSYSQSVAGSDSGEADFDIVKSEEKPNAVPDRPVELQTFLASKAPPREWIVKNWLPKGEITSLYGKGGLGKSLLAMQLSLSVASGVNILDMEVVKPLPVLIISCEDTENELHRRIENISGSDDYDFQDYRNVSMKLWSRVGKEAVLARVVNNKIVKGKFNKVLESLLKEMGDTDKLIVMDTLTDLFAGEESARNAVNYFIKVTLGDIVQRYKASILLIGHPAKSDTSEYSGSTAWNNAVRNRWILAQHEHLDDCMMLVRAKSNYSKTGEGIAIQWAEGAFRRIDDVELMDKEENVDMDIIQEAIVVQCRTGTAYGTHHNAKPNIYDADIMDTENRIMSKDHIKRLLTKLIMEGSIEEIKGAKRGNGLWAT